MIHAIDNSLYRKSVGMMISSRKGIFIGKRLHVSDNENQYWQMPQGGVDSGESFEEAMWRELYEETGISCYKVEIRMRSPNYLYYEIPVSMRKNFWNGKFIGQRQIWFLLRFLGEDHDISIMREPREFESWKWITLSQLADITVPFKSELYRKIIQMFQHML